MIRFAHDYFSFLDDSQARVDVVLGDARLSLEGEPDQRFDILVLDAFSSDAIPVHLLTCEAFATYDRHLTDDGALAVNISNRHLDLVPVLAGLADHYDFEWCQIRTSRDSGIAAAAAHWMVLTRNADLLRDEAIQAAAQGDEAGNEKVTLWTDSYNNLLQVLK